MIKDKFRTVIAEHAALRACLARLKVQLRTVEARLAARSTTGWELAGEGGANVVLAHPGERLPFHLLSIAVR